MNETLRALQARKSVRIFTGEPVALADKAALLDAALQAPTAGNQTLCTILDMTDPAKKERLAALCDHQAFIADAPVVLVFLADCRKWYEAFATAGCAPRAPGAGDLLLAAADACIAAQNVVVAAESLGLGSCYIGDVLENCAAMRELLALPAFVVPAAMLVLGHPTEQQRARPKPPRFDAQYVVRENTYDVTAPLFETMWRAREPEADYAARMQAFCQRKYNSDFSLEMTRSAEEYLRDFLPHE